MNIKYRKALLAILLIAVVLAPRLPGLKSFVTVDEPFWLAVGGNFYYALGQRELQNTVYEYHPAVTTMWFVTAGFLTYFPQFRALDQGYLDVDKNTFDPLLIENGKSPLELLYFSRLFQLLVIVIAALAILHLLSLLIGDEKAFLFTAFVSSSPFFLGHSRVLNHEAMVAFFVLASIFGLMAYLDRDRKWIYLVISGGAAALAQLTKSSAMGMFPVIALVLAVSVFQNMKAQGFGRALIDHLKVFGVWLLALVIVYVILWPGMWVAPGKMLYEVYGNALSYAFQGARLQVTETLRPAEFSVEAPGAVARTFLLDLFWRTTPLTWIGFLLAVLFLFRRGDGSSTVRKLIGYLFLTAVMFVLLFSVAQGRNSAHYIMSSHVSLDGIAALGWGSLFGWLGMQWETAARPTVRVGSVAVIVLLQLGSALTFYPYYYTYYNPVMAGIKGQGRFSDYGEGFEYAAAYLAQKPGAESLRVFSFRGRGPFSYFFPGETIILNPLFIEEPRMESMIERFAQADYLVFNDAMRYRTERTAQFVDALSGVAPEKSISVRGIYTIHIYRVADLPESFYAAIQK